MSGQSLRQLIEQMLSRPSLQFKEAISGKKAVFSDEKDTGRSASTEIPGGELPEISRQTYDLVMRKLEQRKNESEEV